MQSKMEWKVERFSEQVEEKRFLERLSANLHFSVNIAHDAKNLRLRDQSGDFTVVAKLLSYYPDRCQHNVDVIILYQGTNVYNLSAEKLLALNDKLPLFEDMVLKLGQRVVQHVVASPNPIKKSSTQRPLTADDIEFTYNIIPTAVKTETRTVHKVRVWFCLPELAEEPYRHVLKARSGWNPKDFGWQDEKTSSTDEALFEKYSKIAKAMIMKVTAKSLPTAKEADAPPTDCDIYDIVSKTEVKLVSATPTTPTPQ